ncbi:nicotinate-nucleotide adenylyltransferase [Cronobacter dublinensis]|uniref:nicotinate-nucleotide adenylyltransferase n=1 Tax=Cronobacter dublinensis TaxID=413497 RepID=UPI0024AE0B7F|nr:nicotinate-nucleotide adenylyltransferase [Cronobacter dublinensis]EGT4359281.1 nicotinate-nicotinamide nucleotide adenylyltransferase [Cronobacter dublinensis]MDI6477748.1 nicotinate-nucleotide adenylyltransferase [Cronobacter dublinensis]
MADSIPTLRAWYGGTFDPVHYGHLRAVEALAKEAKLTQVTMLPNNVPPHRPQPGASSVQRKEMVELAIAGHPLFRLDARELQRPTPSWTSETMAQLRQEAGPDAPLAFIIGQDSLLTLRTWHRYDDLLACCHLLVCRRPGYPVELKTEEDRRWLSARLAAHADELHRQAAGKIYLADTPLYPISATDIRTRLAQRQPCDDLLPPAVLDYIHRHALYGSSPDAR